MRIKRTIINLYYKYKNKNKYLNIGRSAYILGKKTVFEGYNSIGANSLFQGRIGYGSYIGENSYINATIGRYTCISDRVNTVSGTHPTSKFVSIHPAFYSTAKQAGFTYAESDRFNETLKNPINNLTSVFIGNDVWIGCDVTILGGIVIGDGAIIAAGSIVTKDVEPYSIIGGVPAKLIKKRFTDEQISFLKSFRWWDKDPVWLENNYNDMNNIDSFMCKHNT